MEMRSQPNKNPGFFSVGSGVNCKTIIVCGIPRSGTTAVISVVGEMIPIAYDQPGNMEHWAFNDLIRGGHKLKIDRFVSKQPDRWGFKIPDLFNCPWSIKHFRKPALILPFRDPASVAIRESMMHEITHEQALKRCLNWQSGLLDFAQKSELPRFYLSYEKLMAFPDRTIRALCEFLGCEFSDSHKDVLNRESKSYGKIAGGIKQRR